MIFRFHSSKSFSWALFILSLIEAIFWNSISCEAVFSGLGPEYQQEAKEYINRENGLVKSYGSYHDPEKIENPKDNLEVLEEEIKLQMAAQQADNSLFHDSASTLKKREKQREKRRKLIATRRFMRALTTIIPKKTKEHENPSQGKMFELFSDWEGTVRGRTHSFLQRSLYNIVCMGKGALNFVFELSQLS